jgi:protein SCO1
MADHDTRVSQSPPPMSAAVRHGRAVVAVLALLSLGSDIEAADREYAVRGMVVSVDAPAGSFTVSHERIAGLMDAMTMPFDVRDARELRGIVPGTIVDFTLVVGSDRAYATRIAVRRYETVERDPSTARRLAAMRRLAGMTAPPVAIGARVPDFTLVDQTQRHVALSAFAGKVVVVNFLYTRCALPQFCLRMANNFGVLQRRFSSELGRDLVLLTITFDPQRDTPDVLASYAAQWQANPSGWHFLTGRVADIRRVCALFGQEAFPEEGLMNHSLRTAVIDRTGTLVANIEGNQFTPEQLGDLVLAALRP